MAVYRHIAVLLRKLAVGGQSLAQSAQLQQQIQFINLLHDLKSGW